MSEALLEYSSNFLTVSHKATLKKALGRCTSLGRANEIIATLTGIRGFFGSDDTWESFRAALRPDAADVLHETAQEYGDYQTPLSLARMVCQRLQRLGCHPTLLVEPTCGRGNFIVAALETFPTIRAVYGWEIQESYVTECKANLLAHLLNEPDLKREIHIRQANIFGESLAARVAAQNNDEILILGNPPWVTNAFLSALNSSNLPAKSNFKGHAGLDAMTGKSNFDIAEFILLQLIRDFEATNTTLAMLCKNIVIRNLVEATRTQELPIRNIRAFTFDAAKEFDVACDASLVVANITTERAARTCTVTDLQGKSEKRVFGWVGDHFVADASRYEHACRIEGVSTIVWRQGLKHDCSAVMEMDCADGEWRNGRGDLVEVEPDRVFPLAKGSDLKTPLITRLRKVVIVPQNTIGEDTNSLKKTNPRLWKYLNEHKEAFAARKSSIYREKPPFSIFGVGDYSFKPFKVAMSGLYKSSHFSLLLPINGRPVMLDDTCYLLGFDTLGHAAVALGLLNSQVVQDFLKSIVFPDSKRPYTKDILMRIDLRKVSSLVSAKSVSNYLSKLEGADLDFEEGDYEFFSSSDLVEAQSMFIMEQGRAHQLMR